MPNRAGRVLGTRALNRALLERQMLLRRRRMPAMRAVERLVALQAQVPRDPYVTLWARLEGFRPSTLSDALESRRALRMTLLRATLHLVSARDAVALRPVVQPVVDGMFSSQRAFRESAAGIDLDEVVRVLRRALEERPGTRSDLARVIASRWPDRDAANLAYAMYLIPTVQVTPRGLWGSSGRPAVTTLEHWLGLDGPLGSGAPPAELVRRYLAAYGPASPADFTNWSGLSGVREVFEQLRPDLRVFRDERNRELFDLARAPLPDPDTPAPVRFLAEYDNALLAHADRTRVIPEGVPQWTAVGWGLVLVDGFVSARWKLDQDGGALRVEPFRPLTPAERAEVTAEASHLLAFLEPDAAKHRVRIARPVAAPPNRRPGGHGAESARNR
jgi:Winged helix DNA-binding domain